MIHTKTKPFTAPEIKELREQFDVYIKTVIDIENEICSAGCDRHYDSEQLLLSQGSSQENLWGGGVDLETGIIDFNSMINIRPSQENTSIEIQDKMTREKFEALSRNFFRVLYEK